MVGGGVSEDCFFSGVSPRSLRTLSEGELLGESDMFVIEVAKSSPSFVDEFELPRSPTRLNVTALLSRRGGETIKQTLLVFITPPHGRRKMFKIRVEISNKKKVKIVLIF